jgi:dolichol-phosphate mannosyltransferase
MLLSAFANRYVRAITGLVPRDCTSGFRCWRRGALQRIAVREISSNGYAFLVEMAWLAARAGCRIVEVPITFTERRAGASKLSRAVIVESAIVPWRLKARGRA